MAPRPVKPHNGGQWTEARYKSFIKGGLRSLTNRWGPKSACVKAAWVERGLYTCAGYKQRRHNVPVSVVVDGKRVRNIAVDHISPVIDPKTGFVSWDDVVERMFVEVSGLQLLCKQCHDKKTADERALRKKK